MKGILLAGGSGTRLYPMTLGTSKQLLPIYDKPMLYYPLTILMMAGVREIMIISSPNDLPPMQRLIGDGSQFGISVTYREQPRPEGIAQAFHIAETWLDGSACVLALGDNILFGHNLVNQLQAAAQRAEEGESTLFLCRVSDPERYGVAEVGADGKVLSIEEKPAHPKSDLAVIGLYFYDNQVAQIARQIKPSARGELEITDINRLYLERGPIHAERLNRGYAWLDAGTPDSMLQAAQFVQTIQQRQGLQIGSPEEVAFRLNFISKKTLIDCAETLNKTRYGQYLHDLANGKL